MNSPMCSPCSCGLPHQTGSFADDVTSLEVGTDGVSGFCSGPPSPNSHTPTQIAIQLTMILDIPSFAPAVAFSSPAMLAKIDPPLHASPSTSTTCSTCGMP